MEKKTEGEGGKVDELEEWVVRPSLAKGHPPFLGMDDEATIRDTTRYVCYQIGTKKWRTKVETSTQIGVDFGSQTGFRPQGLGTETQAFCIKPCGGAEKS